MSKQVTEQENLDQTQIQLDQLEEDKGTEVDQPEMIQPINQPETEEVPEIEVRETRERPRRVRRKPAYLKNYVTYIKLHIKI